MQNVNKLLLDTANDKIINPNETIIKPSDETILNNVTDKLVINSQIFLVERRRKGEGPAYVVRSECDWVTNL